jgi:hypothetical protein
MVAIITCADRARGLLASLLPDNAITLGIARAEGLCYGKGFGKTMNTVFYALIYVVAAVLLVTGVFLGIPALTP